MKLRKFTKTDVQDLAKNANTPEVAKYLREAFPSPYSFEAAEWWVTEGHELGNVCNRAIEVDGECIGSIGVRFLEDEHRYTAELGYWLGQPHWGKGIITDAIHRFVPYIFESFEVRRIYAAVAHQNGASIGPLQKCGFEREGIFKNNIFLRGSMYDEHVYAKYAQTEIDFG